MKMFSNTVFCFALLGVCIFCTTSPSVSCKPLSELSSLSKGKAAKSQENAMASKKLRIGVTDTLYAQIRFSLIEVGADPVELTTSQSMNDLFLSVNRPALLLGKSEAEIESVDLSTNEPYARKRWDVNLYKIQGGILDRYVEENRGKFQNPSQEAFLSPMINMAYVRKQMEQLDGLVVGGGEDVNPRFYFAKDLQIPNPKGSIEENVYARTRDVIELAYIGEALRQGKPILGICRGEQVLGVALGGRLIQDIPTAFPMLLQRHSMPQEFLKSEGHEVEIPKDSLFARILGLNKPGAGSDAKRVGSHFVIGVNSYHHQSVSGDFPGIEVNARDGGNSPVPGVVVEGFVARGTHNLVMGVQWHPERPFATQGSSVAASAMPFVEWKKWFETDSRRPYYKSIWENFVACAAHNSLQCIK